MCFAVMLRYDSVVGRPTVTFMKKGAYLTLCAVVASVGFIGPIEASQQVPTAHSCSVSETLHVRDLKKGQQHLVSPTQPMNCVYFSVVLATAELRNVSDLTLLSGSVTLENTDTKDITVAMTIHAGPKGECSESSLIMPVTIRSGAGAIEAHYALNCGRTSRLSQKGEVVLTIYAEKSEYVEKPEEQ